MKIRQLLSQTVFSFSSEMLLMLKVIFIENVLLKFFENFYSCYLFEITFNFFNLFSLHVIKWLITFSMIISFENVHT